MISTIYSKLSGTFFSFIYLVFSSLYLRTFTHAFFLLFNFDFVLRNWEDLDKKVSQADFCMTLFFHSLLFVLILDDFTVVVLQFRALICQPCRGFHTPVASCIPHCFSTFDVVEAINCSFRPLHPPPAPKGFMV